MLLKKTLISKYEKENNYCKLEVQTEGSGIKKHKAQK